MGAGEKAKDFKSAIKRLFKELSGYKFLIVFSMVLAIIGAILSISAPNRLSDLTDEISNGLVVKQDALKEITSKISVNMQESITNIIDVQSLSESFANVMASPNISQDDKAKLQEAINVYAQDTENQERQMNLVKSILNLSDETLKILLPDSTYKDVNVTSEEKIALLKMMTVSNEDNNTSMSIPENYKNILLEDIEVDGETISVDDQYVFLSKMSNANSNSDVNDLYRLIEEMPGSIKNVIKPAMNIDTIKFMALVLVCIYLASAICTYIQSISMTTVANKFANKLRSKISVKINKLPLKYFDRHQTGDILSRVTNDVDTIAQTMNQSLATLVSSITLFLGTIIMMFVTNWIMAFTAIGASLIGFLGMSVILKNSQKYFVSRQVELGNLNGHIEEIYSGLNVVKVYNGKKKASEEFDILNKKVRESNRKSQFLSGLMQPMMGFIGNFGYVAVCIVGALLTMKGKISFGVIVAFISYVRLFTSPLAQIAQAMTSLQSTAAASERVFEFVDEEEMSSQEHITKKLDRAKVKGKIEFKDVVFQYDNNDKPTIKNFTAVANPGQKIAIVGPTGAGKTTMVNLLMKFYEINSGEIKIDGVPISELSRENVHELFTMVLQDTWLFDGTIKENIIYNRSHISDERVVEVCKEVGLNHFIKTLPHGYDSKISNNDSVSAGQRQLLTIARGMIEDSPFLILDEATSNVDTRTEELVQDAMDKLTKGKTSFIIAHRLSTIKNADLILVMKDGNIIEQGNHDELIEKNGFYADLYNAQFEL
jgi:ATP-binding cassette subfamily B protein